MSQNFWKSIFFLLVLISFTEAKSQISISYFGNSDNSKIGLAYDFNEKLWTELRVYSGTSIENTTAEAVLNYNFIRKETYETYFGGGVVVNNLNGLVLPIGARFTPFEGLKNFSFHIEFQPMYEIDYGDVFINGFAGIRYKFN